MSKKMRNFVAQKEIGSNVATILPGAPSIMLYLQLSFQKATDAFDAMRKRPISTRFEFYRSFKSNGRYSHSVVFKIVKHSGFVLDWSDVHSLAYWCPSNRFTWHCIANENYIF